MDLVNFSWSVKKKGTRKNKRTTKGSDLFYFIKGADDSTFFLKKKATNDN